MCDDSIFVSVTQSCYFAGMLVALLVGGSISDYFGRRSVLCAGFYIIIIATWIMIYPKVFVVFIVCRVLIGIGSGMQTLIGASCLKILSRAYYVKRVVQI